MSNLGSIVTLTTTQTNSFNAYDAGTCNCFICPAENSGSVCPNGDWKYSTLQCCGGMCSSVAQCSKIDPDVCPKIGTGPISTSWTIPGSVSSNGASVNCNYGVNQFQTVTDIKTWIQLQGKDNQYDSLIMPQFCSQQVTTCPLDRNQIPMPNCNRLLSTGEDGDICRDWQINNPTQADMVIQNYCSNTRNLFGCDCVRREYDITYQTGKKYIEAPDACWFKPCQTPTQELIPSDLKNPICPANYCVGLSTITSKDKEDINPAELSCPLPLAQLLQTTNRSYNVVPIILSIIIIVIILIILGIVIFYSRS